MPELTIEQALQMALRHHQAGDLARAEHMYRRILDHVPQHPDALHLMGVLASQNGQHEAAVGFIEKAISVNPDVVDFHNNLGEALRRAGHTERAIACYEKAISLRPDYADAHNNLAAALNKAGRHAQAVGAAERASEINPSDPDPQYNRGIALFALNRFEDSVASLMEAVKAAPHRAEFHKALGDALRAAGRTDEAIAAYKQSIGITGGDDADVFQSLGEALVGHGRIDEAIDTLKQLCELRPTEPDAHNNLGLLYEKTGRFDDALKEYEAAIRAGKSPEAHNNLANYLNSQSKLDRSLEEYRKALAIDATFYEAWSNLANALVELGELDEGLDAYHKALQLKPDFAGARSNMLLAILYNPRISAMEVAAEHKRWEEVHGAPLRSSITPHKNDRSPKRKLRIGYVSPDFRSHAVAFFSLPVLTSHDRSQFEVICFSNNHHADGITARFQKAAAGWHNIVTVSDNDAAALIGEQKIDILVDLAGHTANNRLPVFARKPAPIQMTAWGYPHSTGLSSIDYKVSDAYCDPPGENEELNSEKLIRMPDIFWCYNPPEDSPDIGPLPMKQNGYVTFGCFNTIAKVTPQVMETWARVLAGLPGSRLILKANALGGQAGRDRVTAILGSHGIAADRLELSGRGGFREYQELFNRVDLSLDPFPFNGGTTTCHSLWMGVPVVTRAGAGHQGRMGVSIMSCIGMPDFIARDLDDYVCIAARFANDASQLAQIRATMRDRLRATALLDARTYTRNLEAEYRRVWREWCEKT